MSLQDFLARLFGPSASPSATAPIQSTPAEAQPVRLTTAEQAAQEEMDQLIWNVTSPRYYQPTSAQGKALTPFQVAKARQAMERIIEQCDECFSTKLITCLWKADQRAYNELDHSITGFVYRMTENGMIPVGLDIMNKLPFFSIVEKSYSGGHVGKVYQLTSYTGENPLSRREIEILDQVARELNPMNAHKLNALRQPNSIPLKEVYRF